MSRTSATIRWNPVEPLLSTTSTRRLSGAGRCGAPAPSRQAVTSDGTSGCCPRSAPNSAGDSMPGSRSPASPTRCTAICWDDRTRATARETSPCSRASGTTGSRCCRGGRARARLSTTTGGTLRRGGCAARGGGMAPPAGKGRDTGASAPVLPSRAEDVGDPDLPVGGSGGEPRPAARRGDRQHRCTGLGRPAASCARNRDAPAPIR